MDKENVLGAIAMTFLLMFLIIVAKALVGF